MIRLRRRTEDGHSLLLKLIKSSGTFVLQLRATGPIRAQSQEFLKCEALSAHLSWSIQVIPKKCSLFGYVQWSCSSTDLHICTSKTFRNASLTAPDLVSLQCMMRCGSVTDNTRYSSRNRTRLRTSVKIMAIESQRGGKFWCKVHGLPISSFHHV